MRRLSLALTFLVLAATTAPAGEKNTDTPAIVLRVKSLEALLQNLNLVVKLVGQDEAALSIEGVIKGKIGKKGLEGIDPARPFGAYARFGKTFDELTGAVLIPVADEKAFLTLVDNLNLAVAKDKAGIYTHKTKQNIDVYFRFAHKYVFVTAGSAESIQDRALPDPAQALALSGDATLAIAVRVDRIPLDAKLVALKHLDDAIMAAEMNGAPNETKVQKAFRIALLHDVKKLGASLIDDATEVRLDLDVSDKTKEINVNLSIAGKPGSALAKTIRRIGELKSPLAGLAAKDVAFHGNIHFVLPEELNTAFSAVIKEVQDKSVEGIQDAKKKMQAEELFKALMPSATAGEFQFTAVALGPKNDHYAFVGAVKLKDGVELGRTVGLRLLEALKDIPEEQRGKIQLDFDKAGAIAIHKFELPKNPAIDKILEDIVRDRDLYLAFRADALFLALGQDALPALKTAIAAKDAAASVPFLFDFDAARMARLMAQTKEQKDLAAKLFPAGQTGRVRLAIEGGETLSARLRMQLNVLEFLVKATSK